MEDGYRVSIRDADHLAGELRAPYRGARAQESNGHPRSA